MNTNIVELSKSNVFASPFSQQKQQQQQLTKRTVSYAADGGLSPSGNFLIYLFEIEAYLNSKSSNQIFFLSAEARVVYGSAEFYARK